MCARIRILMPYALFLSHFAITQRCTVSVGEYGFDGGTKLPPNCGRTRSIPGER